MTPHPPRKPSEEHGVLDAVLQKIDASLLAIHRMRLAKTQTKKCSSRRSGSITTEEIKTKFQRLSEEPILTDDGLDIRGCKPAHINGAAKNGTKPLDPGHEDEDNPGGGPIAV